MKINITKSEYRLLLDVLSISDWVMNSHKIGKNPKSEPYKELEQKFMSFAKDFGCEKLVMYDERYESFFPTAEYENQDTDRPFIEEFEEEVFWEELCNRLGQRDLLKEKGIQKVKEMDPIERMTAEDKIAEKYNKEFIENGIKNLIISGK